MRHDLSTLTENHLHYSISRLEDLRGKGKLKKELNDSNKKLREFKDIANFKNNIRFIINPQIQKNFKTWQLITKSYFEGLFL